MLNRFFILLLIGLSLLTLHPVHAQTPPSTAVLDALPPCGYTAAAPDGNILVGAVVYNLQTGTGCAENLDTLFPVASVPKVFVAAAFFQTVLETDGLINFQTPITFSDRYWMSGRNSCLDVRALNAQVAAGKLSDMMIACGDNAATCSACWIASRRNDKIASSLMTFTRLMLLIRIPSANMDRHSKISFSSVLRL